MSVVSRFRLWLFYFATIAAMAGLFFSDLSNHGIALDDVHYLIHSKEVSKDFRHFFSTDRLYPGRPVVDLVFWIGFEIWGTDASKLHLIPVVFHAVVSLLVAIVCRLTGANTVVGFLAGILFLTNVAHFHAIQWLAAVAYPLALLFALLATVCYLLNVQFGHTIWIFGLYISMFLAVLSHASAIAVLPFLFFLHSCSKFRSTFLILFPLGALSVTVLVSLVIILPESIQVYKNASNINAETIVQNCFLYLGRLVTTDRWFAIRPHVFTHWELILGLVVFLAALASIFKGKLLSRIWGCWLLLTVLVYANAPNIDFVGTAPGPSRFLYFSSVATSIFAARIIASFSTRLTDGGVYRSVLLLLLLVPWQLISFTSHRQARAISLFDESQYSMSSGDLITGVTRMQQALAQGADVIPIDQAYLTLFSGLLRQGRSATDLVEKALRHYPHSYALNALAGVLLPGVGIENEENTVSLNYARKVYNTEERVGTFDSLMASIHMNIGEGIVKREGLSAQAQKWFMRALSYDPDNVKLLVELGSKFGNSGDNTFAEACFKKAITLNNRSVDGYYNLALLYEKRGDLQDAVAAFNKVIDLSPRHAISYFLLGITYNKLGFHENAIETFHHILPYCIVDTEGFGIEVPFDKISPKQAADAFCHLGLAYRAVGENRKALSSYISASKFDPRSTKIHLNIVLMSLLAKDTKTARLHYATLATIDSQEAAKISHLIFH